MDKAERKARIRELNNSFRKTFTGGRVMMTHLVKELPDETRDRLVKAVQAFNAFNRGNDPHGEYDFGIVEIDGSKFFFKIDYYDLAMNQHSVDAANAEATMRVLTIMHADEY